jgi:hypothetical protein
MPVIAQSYALTLATNMTKRDFAKHAQRHFNSDGSLKTTPAEYSQETDGLSLLICALKAHNCEHTLKGIHIVRGCMGGQGVIAGNRIGEWSNTVVTLGAAEGDTVLLQQKTSRQLLGDVLKDGPPEEPDATKAVGQFSSASLEERFEGIEGLLRLREVRVLMDLASRMMALRGEGLDTMLAWNSQCLPTAQALHEAYCERVVFAEFRAVCGGTAVAAPEAAELFSSLCLVHGLENLEKHLGWYLGNVPEFSRELGPQIASELERLCLSFSEQRMLACTDAYGYPDATLCFPAAKGKFWMDMEK